MAAEQERRGQELRQECIGTLLAELSNVASSAKIDTQTRIRAHTAKCYLQCAGDGYSKRIANVAAIMEGRETR